MHHAPADGIAELKSHLVEAFNHQPCPSARARILEHSIPLPAAIGQVSRSRVAGKETAVIKKQKIRRSLAAPAD
jgi:hypothetical protein